jgi:hypothetical protein
MPGDLSAAKGSTPVETPPEIMSLDVHDQGSIWVTIRGAIGVNYALETSSDLLNWAEVDVQTNLTGSVMLREPRTTNSIRFYRAVSKH